MLDKKWLSISTNIYFVAAAIGFCGLWFSPFVVSLATVVLGLLFLSHVRSWRFPIPKLQGIVIVLGLLAVPALVDATFGGFSGVAGAKVGLLLGFTVSAVSGFWFMSQGKTRLVSFALFLCVVVAVVDILSVSNYFLHKKEIDALLLQSKSIPIPNMHHIHFGIINAICVLLLIGLLFLGKTQTVLQFRLGIILLVIIFVSTHILSSRTGLLSVYIALLFGGLHYSLYTRNLKMVASVSVGLLLCFTGAYYLSDSLHNKIANSIEDIQSWGSSEQINHKSMAMRIEAYKASTHTLINHPLGVGANLQKSKMDEGYDAIESPLWQENRIGPHNQFLEFGVKYGWIGLLLIVVLIFSLGQLGGRSTFIYSSFVILLLVSMQFESLLERQASLYFLALFVPLFAHLFCNINHTYNPLGFKNVQ